MIFGEESIKKIISGEKTMTRRLRKENENVILDDNGDIFSVVEEIGSLQPYVTRLKWQVGNSYAVCHGRGKAQYEIVKGASCSPLWITITAIKRENLLDISTKDACKEGYENTHKFFQAFSKINKLTEFNSEVWVLEFRKGL